MSACRPFHLLALLAVCLLAHNSALAAPPECPLDAPSLPAVTVAPPAGEAQPLPFCRLADDTYLLPGAIAQLDTTNRGWMGNAGFVVTDEGVVVIDALGTPYLGARLIATIRSVTDRPLRYLIVTHNHPDHSYGASALRALPGVTVIAHHRSRDYLDAESFATSVAYRQALLPQDMAGFSGVAPDLPIEVAPFTAQRITLGGKAFDIYNSGNHHSWGDLVVHQRDQQIVWIADLAFNSRTTFIADGHSRAMLDGLDWLSHAFPAARLMVPGHGSAQRPPFPMVARTQGYIERLRTQMGHAVEQGADMQQALDNSDLPDWREVPLYKENHRANAQFIYQEMEQELF